MVAESQITGESANLVTQLNETSTSITLNSAANILEHVPTNVIPSTSNLETVASSIEPAFSSLGLAHGWPSGWMQALLESIYTNTDLSWSGTIILTTLAMRLCVFPIMLHARKVMVNTNHNLPTMQKYQYEMHIAKTKQEAILAMKKLKKFQKENGINPSAQFVPMVSSGVVMATMFFALRGMSSCPVESMKVGGMGWFLDLTTRDPYFILPILTASTLALNMKLGMDATDSSQTPEQLKKFMKYGIPAVTLIGTCTFPSSLCLYWFISNIISVTQGALLRIPAVKNATGVGEFKTWDDADLPMKNISMFDQAAAIQPTNKMPHSSTNTQNFDKMGIEEALRKAELRKKAKEN
jgi:YidC/Oxa1 family membrane protein insertase